MESQSNQESIVIKDYNAAFMWYLMKYVGFATMFIVLVIYPLLVGTEPRSMAISTLIIVYPMYMQYMKSKYRKIVLTDAKILYESSEKSLAEIDLTKNVEYYLSYQNYYHKNQDLPVVYAALVWLLCIVVMQSFFLGTAIVAIAFVGTFLLAQLTKYFISDFGFRFYSFLLVKTGEEVVSIPLFEKHDYMRVKEFFHDRQIDIETLPKFFKPFYGIERNI